MTTGPPNSAAVQSATHTSVTSAHPGPVAAAAPSCTVLAIDPGNEQSAYVVIDVHTRRPLDFGKVANDRIIGTLPILVADAEAVAIEMVASYGMPVGAEVFETCVWIGRYLEALGAYGIDADLVKRLPVKVHHCHTSKAKDSNITQALVDRFAPGQPNHGKGTKASPGWFYGFKADVWQAYALAVYVADTQPLPTPLISVSASVESSLPVPGADTDNQTAALSLPRDGAAPAPHPNPMRGCGAGPQAPAVAALLAEHPTLGAPLTRGETL